MSELRDDGPHFVEWVGEGYRERRMRWGAFVYLERGTRNGVGSKDYTVTREAGEWPSDADLITLCDGSAPARPHHFGGNVSRTGDRASVTVNVD